MLLKFDIAAKKEYTEECNLLQNNVRCPIDRSDMANEEKAFSFHFNYFFYFFILISRELNSFVLEAVVEF